MKIHTSRGSELIRGRFVEPPVKGATSRTAHARILTIILKKLAQPFQVCRAARYSKFILIYLRHP